jgi:hypothetical protein
MASTRRDKLRLLEKEKEVMLNKEMEACDHNIKVLGLKYKISMANKRNGAGRTAWRMFVLQSVLVDTKIVKASKVIHQLGPNKGKEIRGILHDAYPLHENDNALIVVAFLETSLSKQVKDALRYTGLRLGDIKILPHYPDIIESLKDEALRERGALLGADGARKIVCQTTITKPWVRLIEITEQDGGPKKRTAIPFNVEDGRLAKPARTLAALALEGKTDFVKFDELDEKERAQIPTNIQATFIKKMYMD